MVRLEELTKDAVIKGILPNVSVKIVDVEWHGDDVITVIYLGPNGAPQNELIYRDHEPNLEVVQEGRPWSFSEDGKLLQLVSEAMRINYAHLFDPVLAVHTSLVRPLPHQITAVYEEMLMRQPLRFLLADDPGAGKTIMAGLLIKELMARGDVRRCMIVSPGTLVEQWQDELSEKFNMPFEIMTNDSFNAARTGNWFQEHDLAICRLDKLSRNEDVQEKLKITDWDLIVVDEAHKMSASYFGGEKKETKRYKLGKFLAGLTRHFLLMTATPHNGKEEDFQLFLALLDGDRFEGKYREGVHTQDASDVMRRMVKEQLVKFDETPLFPERRAYTVTYKLSDMEASLYTEVSDYVRDEFNRADALQNDGRKGTVGFALTVLQRRLASSPEAIYQSLRRRRERLEQRLREEKILHRGGQAKLQKQIGLPAIGNEEDEVDEVDFEDLPGDELEENEDKVVDLATAAQTIEELQVEVNIVRQIEKTAEKVRKSGDDSKWEQLSSLLQDNENMFDAHNHRRKLVIFTEHRDTLNYLTDRIRVLLGNPDAVVTISGGMLRDDRRKAQERFTQDKETLVLIATDAAGEGINLQRAHLMVNYDLPWNPNRLEQRFGRIHRIGQTEVCHLWNLVAGETREGDVFQRLLEKLEVERQSLKGAVFDVLGRAIEGRKLKELLVEAIRYGELPEVRAKLKQKVDQALDHDKFKRLIEDRAIADQTMDTTKVRKIRDDMERAEARKLQPHFVSNFFINAFQHLGGRISQREANRYEITRVPSAVRSRDRQIGTRDVVLKSYERVTFEKDLINVPGKPVANFVCPGHPLLDSTIDIILEKHRDVLKQGAILIDDNDFGSDPEVLFYLDHAINDAKQDRNGNQRTVSRRLEFVAINERGDVRPAGYAPYLDYRAASDQEVALLDSVLQQEWLNKGLEKRAQSFAISDIVPKHLQEVKHRREEIIDKTLREVRDRLTKEINHWDHRAQALRLKEESGKKTRINSVMAERRATELSDRLQQRTTDLEQQRSLKALPPVVFGGALIVPKGLLLKLQGEDSPETGRHAKETKRVELLAMDAVMEAERKLGNEPRDCSAEKCGYDIESKSKDAGQLRFIEVKGRHVDADHITVTYNEVVTGVNCRSKFILAIVQVDGDAVAEPVYVREPFEFPPDAGVTSSNYAIRGLLERGNPPA